MNGEAKVEMNVEVNEREERKIEAHQLLEQGWGAMNSVALERFLQLMVDFRKELLLSMGASVTTNMALGGSISQKQIGAKRGATANISQRTYWKLYEISCIVSVHRQQPICEKEVNKWDATKS